jgi:hypothetical protein
MRKSFIYKEDQEYGNLGWVELNAPDCFNTGDGRLVAHDTLEHFKPIYGNYSVEDELLALGASMYIRGEQGYFADRHSPSIPDQYSPDVERCIAVLLNNSVSTITRKVRAIPCEEDLQETVHKACTEYNYLLEGTVVPAKLQEHVKHLLRAGYRKAAKRFHGDASGACNLFMQIEAAVNNVTKYADEGDMLVVSFNATNLDYNVRRVPLFN